jgi:uncharacterized membrane protein (DUF485 family)
LEHHHLTPAEWDSVAQDPEFRSLVQARRTFVIPATVFFIVYYLALPLSTGFAPQVMNRPVWGPLTLAYVFAFSQFAMVWILLALYMRRARRFDDMAAAIVERTKMEIEK